MKVILNPNVRGMPPSATVAINDLSARLGRAGHDIYRLGLGQSPFPVPEPVVAALRANAHQKDYLPVKGLWPLREAIAEHHARNFGVECTPRDVLVGPGSKELMFLLQLTYFGDLVIPTPTWVSYAPQARIIGRNIRLLPTHRDTRWHLEPDQLEALCREDPDWPRILILTYPSNPTGLTLDEDRLRALARVARKYNVVLLSDEIYGRLQFEGEHRSIVPHYPEGTIFSGGLSKWCGAGGWRLGLFVFPPNLRWLLEAMAAVASETYTSTSAPIQYAAITAFRDEEMMEDYLFRSRRVLQALTGKVVEMLAAIGADVTMPDGAFYLFPDFEAFRERLRAQGIETADDLCRQLLEDTNVAILPGSAFGRDAEELTVRIATVDFDGGDALAAAAEVPAAEPLDEAFLRAHCGRVLTAIDRMVEWLQR